MANKQDIDRWKKGKDYWNKWAEGRLKAKEKLEKEGKWEVDSLGEGANAETERWLKSASVKFSEHDFEEDADFNGFVFPHTTNFERAEFRKDAGFGGATFSGTARFGGATFTGDAGFGGATFTGDAGFGGATFSGTAGFGEATFTGYAWFDRASFTGYAWFGGATFTGDAWFDRAIFTGDAEFGGATFTGDAEFGGATFTGYAWFGQIRFEGATSFDNANFFKQATFRSTTSNGPFSLVDAKFHKVPDLIQMSFRATARLDDLEVIQAIPYQFSGDRERAARYRALKKIAIESHDHVREQNFFASEARERRGNDDPIWGANWWFGLAYELFSHFGRSITRPLGWLLASIIVFAAVYGTGSRFPCTWPRTWVLPEFYLSFLNSLPLVGFARAHGRELAETCLFGTSGTIRPAMDMLFIGQNIWSAVLIFLFLLAVRNHFRIK